MNGNSIWQSQWTGDVATCKYQHPSRRIDSHKLQHGKGIGLSPSEHTAVIHERHGTGYTTVELNTLRLDRAKFRVAYGLTVCQSSAQGHARRVLRRKSVTD